eukprot:739724-Rhodomonas_salina.1
MLPVEMYQMTKLDNLNLQDNEFVGNMEEVVDTKPTPEILKFLEALSVSKSSAAIELNGRGYSTVPGILRKYDEVVLLDLSKNGIYEVPSMIGLMLSLTNLNLRSNKLSTLPGELQAVDKLKELDLGQNRMKEVPPCIQALQDLKKFWMDRNAVRRLPVWMSALVSLFYLNVDSNKIKELEPTFQEMEQLRQVHMRSNRLIQMPEVLCVIPGMQELYLSESKNIFLLPGMIQKM